MAPKNGLIIIHIKYINSIKTAAKYKLGTFSFRKIFSIEVYRAAPVYPGLIYPSLYHTPG